jgi:hypothetical protein
MGSVLRDTIFFENWIIRTDPMIPGVLKITTGVLENKAYLLRKKSRLSLAGRLLIARDLLAYVSFGS